MSQSRLVLSVAIALVIGRSVSAQQPWPMFQFDERHSGYLPIAVDVGSIKLRWQKTIGAQALNPVTISNDKVFVTQRSFHSSATLWAVDPGTGGILWSTPLGSPATVNPPSYADGRVYLQTVNHASDTYLRCYDADDGATVFIAPHAAQWESYLAPTIKDQVVYVNGGYFGGMYAFDAVAGTQLWFTGLPQYDKWTPAVDAGAAYSYVGGLFYALNRSDGTIAYQITDPNYSWVGYSMNLAPVLGGANNALVIYNGRLVSFDLLNKSIGYDVPGSFSGQPSVLAGVIYAVDGGELVALDELTGAELWSWGNPGKSLLGTVIVTDSHVFVRSSTTIYAVDPASRTSVWSYADSGDMSIGTGAIYLARSDGKLTALEFEQVPNPLRIDPPRSWFTDLPIDVTIHGAGFQDDTTTPVVRFGGGDATNVVVVDDATITCTAPPVGPGLVDVTVQNTFGVGTLHEGLIALPATDMTGNFFVGGSIDLTFYSEPNNDLLVLLGVPPAVSLRTPPYDGTLCILPFFVFFTLTNWPFEDLTMHLEIPDDPALSGLPFLLQALSGPVLFGHGKNGAWTNCLERTIE